MTKQSRFRIELFLTATLIILLGGKCGARTPDEITKNFNLSVGEIEDWKVHVDPKMLDGEYAAEGTPALTIQECSTDYLFGIDLFNHGFYCEAHEIWKQAWIS